MQFILKVLLVLALFAVAACGNNTTKETGRKEAAATEDPAPVKSNVPEVPVDATYLITTASFFGISPGDPLSKHADIMQKATLSTGEGDFEIYEFKNETGETLGYTHPDISDENLVGDIVITYPWATTEEGVRIGMTFGELRTIFDPPLEVHGSEIEGYTSAQHGNISFRLDTYQSAYDVDESTLSPTIEVMEITLSRILKATE